MSTADTNVEQGDDARGWFQTTHWSVVLGTGLEETARADAALSNLCRAYWYPVYSYLRRVGHGPEDAEDLTQEFFARLIAKKFLKGIEPGRGKFRSFLLTALNRFRANEWDRENRLKRGGGQKPISLDGAKTEHRFLAEPMDEAASPEKLFERRWAMALLEQILAKLESEFCASSNAGLFAQLKPLLSGEQTELSYAQLGQRFGISEANVKVTVHRLRRRYRELLREEVANTVESPDQIDDEIRHLFAAFS